MDLFTWSMLGVMAFGVAISAVAVGPMLLAEWLDYWRGRRRDR